MFIYYFCLSLAYTVNLFAIISLKYIIELISFNNFTVFTELLLSVISKHLIEILMNYFLKI